MPILLLILILIVGLVLLFYLPIGSIYISKIGGIKISIKKIFQYRFNKIPIYFLVQTAIDLKNALIYVDIEDLVNQYKLGTDIYNVRDGLIEAKNQGLFLTFERACLADRYGIHITKTVENTLKHHVEKKNQSRDLV